MVGEVVRETVSISPQTASNPARFSIKKSGRKGPRGLGEDYAGPQSDSVLV